MMIGIIVAFVLYILTLTFPENDDDKRYTKNVKRLRLIALLLATLPCLFGLIIILITYQLSLMGNELALRYVSQGTNMLEDTIKN